MSRRILFLNWRDPLNPNSGGSELYAFEIAKRLALDGFLVTYLTSSFKGSLHKEILYNVHIVRMGNSLTLYPRAFFWMKEHNTEYDVIIEIINGFPFMVRFTKLESKHLTIIFHLPSFIATCKKLLVIGPFEFIISRAMLKLFYLNTTVITDGESSKSELISMHFSTVHVIEDGLESVSLGLVEFHKENLVVISGPLKPWKKIDHGILAFSALPNNWKLIIIGRGNKRYLHYLMNMIKKNNLSSRVELAGYVSLKEKINLYTRSKINIVTSDKEGFSLTALESARYGSVCVGYNNVGVRDAVINGKTGLLVERNNIDELKKALFGLATDNELWKTMSKNCIAFSRNFTWDKTYLQFLEVLKDIT